MALFSSTRQKQNSSSGKQRLHIAPSSGRLQQLLATQCRFCPHSSRAPPFPPHSSLALPRIRPHAPLRHLDEKAAVAKTAIVDCSAQAYDVAAKSQLAAKGAETISSAYTTVVNQPAVVAVSAKTGEAAGQLRSKLAEKLVELREGGERAAPVGSGAV